MPETPPIPPALSAEHWALIGSAPRVVNGQAPVVFTGGLREPGVPGVRGLAVDPKTEPHALTAALNAALPDGHAGKITRVIVDDLRIAQREARKAVAADCMNGPCDECKAACERFCARLEAHALALESILPPAPDSK